MSKVVDSVDMTKADMTARDNLRAARFKFAFHRAMAGPDVFMCSDPSKNDGIRFYFSHVIAYARSKYATSIARHAYFVFATATSPESKAKAKADADAADADAAESIAHTARTKVMIGSFTSHDSLEAVIDGIIDKAVKGATSTEEATECVLKTCQALKFSEHISLAASSAYEVMVASKADPEATAAEDHYAARTSAVVDEIIDKAVKGITYPEDAALCARQLYQVQAVASRDRAVRYNTKAV